MRAGRIGVRAQASGRLVLGSYSRWIGSLVCALTLLVGTLAIPGDSLAGTIIIAKTGDSAPDANGSFLSFPARAALSDSGQVSFVGDLTGTSGGSGDDRGIFRGESSSTLVQIAREGQAAPDGNGSYNSFSTLYVPVNNSAQTAFNDTLSGTSGGTSDDRGVFRGDGGALIQIAREGQAPPDANGSFSSFGSGPALNTSGQVALYAFLTGTSGGSADNSGLYRGSGGALTQIVREGQSAPDSDGNFSSFETSPALNDSGQIAFTANLIGTSADEGLFRGDGGVITQIVRVGQAPPDSNGSFSSFTNNPALNASGQVAFRANLIGTSGGTPPNIGIFRGDGGTITQMARRADAVPDGNGIFNTFDHPTLNDSGQTAFAAALSATSGGGADDEGVFRSEGGSITQIAREGQAAPDGNGSFVNLFNTHVSLNSSGLTAFFAHLAGTSGGTADDVGIYLGDGQELVQAARKGEALAGSTITTMSFVTHFPSLSNGRDGLNDFGQVAYIATLVSGGQAVTLFTPDLRWRTAGNGDWDTATGWTLSISPAHVHDTTIDPSSASTVTGPAADTTVKSLTLGGGGATAQLKLQAGINLTATDGVSVGQDGILSGAATVTGDLTVQDGGVIAPGASSGTMNVMGATTWGLDGAYQWELNDDTGTAGSDPGWDLLSMTGSLSITADSSNPFVIDITSLSGTSPGNAIFDTSLSQTFRIATASDGVTGFDASSFLLSLANLSNSLDGGTFAIVNDGNDINLVFSAAASSNTGVPEPSTLTLAVLGFLALLKRRRSRHF